jgi:hypothetical protein
MPRSSSAGLSSTGGMLKSLPVYPLIHSGKRQGEKQVIRDNPAIDPHYKLMVDYDEAPDSWYFLAFASSFIVSMVCIYVLRSSLPWWGLIIANIFLWIFMLFFGAQYAITGFQFNLGNTCQTLAGYLFPGKPLGTQLRLPTPFDFD